MTRLIILFALLFTFGCSTATKVVAPDSIKEKTEDLAFELALQGLVKDSHEAEMKALEAQKTVLERIETSLAEIDTKLEASSKPVEPSKTESGDSPQKSVTPNVEPKPGGSEVVKSGDEFGPEPQDDSDSNSEWASNALVRQPGPRWNWEGVWNVSPSTAQAHLAEHGINVSGFTMEQMQIVHDNLHNGYGHLYGNGAAKTTTSAPVKTQTFYYSAPKKSSRRTFRLFNSSCPNGRCPQ